MAVDYAEIAEAPNEMLAEYGAPVVITRQGAGEYNPTTSEMDVGLPQVFNGVGVRFDYKLSEIDGTLIQRGDARFYLGTQGLQRPLPGDELEFAGEKYKVIDCTPLQPADVAVLFEAQVRR